MKDWLRAQPPAVRALLSAVGVLVAVTIAVQVFAPDNHLTAGILQALTFLTGIFATFVVVKTDAEEAGKAFVRPYAGSAFRRMLNLYEALGRQGQAIAVIHESLVDAADADGKVSMDQVTARLYSLELMVVEQSATANDAIEDWRSLAPDQVREIDARVIERERSLMPEQVGEVETASKQRKRELGNG